MLKYEQQYKELEKAGIIKNLIVDSVKMEFSFEFAVPEEDVMRLIKEYLLETYGVGVYK